MMKTLILFILLTGTANADVWTGAAAGGDRAYDEAIRDRQRYNDQEMQEQTRELQRQQEQTREFTERYQDMQYNEYPYAIRY